MIWFRIDNRLIHGQVIETWLPYTRATHLVVCNEKLAVDQLQQQIMLLAVPSRIHVDFIAPANLRSFLDKRENKAEKTLVLLANCADARKIYDSGVHFTMLNIGNLHYSPGKRQVCAHVALSDEDATCLHSFADQAVVLDFRCVPNDIADITDW